MLTITTPTLKFKNRGLTHTQLQQVPDYICTHLDRDLSLAELAETLNLSPTYFASAFKQAINISPHQYVIQQRVERAKMMLSKTNLAIADIALQIGFSSQSHGLNLTPFGIVSMQPLRTVWGFDVSAT